MAKEQVKKNHDRFGRPATELDEKTKKAIHDSKTGRLLDRVFIKPCTPETKIRDPKTQLHLPASGKSVKMGPFWLKRLTQGDVVIAKPEKQKAPVETDTGTDNASEE